nr:integrase, catalytic region, zinc finger, CCHC-type, peptidase aspartic, catalytic [Tanacetum cinerariifolium]
EAAKFVGDFKSLAKEADESLAKHKALELEIERLLRAVDNTRGMSMNIKFAKQSILEKPYKIGETHALSKPVTSNSIPTPQESKVIKNDEVIAPGMFRINPFKTSREEKHVPNNDRASVRTKRITVSQPPVFTKKDVNSDSNGLSSTGIDNTKTKRPQPRSNTKNDRVPTASTSSCNKNKGVENVISKLVCAMCKQCLISVNHDVCLRNYVNGKTSRGKKQKANVSIKEKQKKQQPKVKKTKKVGFIERLATPKPSKPRFFLRWSPTGTLFDLKGKKIASSESESQSDCSNGDNTCTSHTLEPKIKRFLNSTFFLGRLSKFVYGYPDLFMMRRLRLFQAHDEKSKASHQFRLKVYGNCQFCDSDLEVAFRRNACFVESESQSDCSNGDNACCSKHMTGNLKLLINFVWKFMGTVRFENDHVAAILGFGDLQWGNILITKVYFIEGLGHNFFLVGQFCDSNLEVAFRRNTCFVKNIEGVDLLKRNRTTNLYTINLHDMASASPICLMARASSTKSWLWHQRLSHLNFDTINDLAKSDLVSGLLVFVKLYIL